MFLIDADHEECDLKIFAAMKLENDTDVAFKQPEYPSYKMGPMEITLVVLLFLIWFYALKRFYTVWSNVLNFSAISDGGQDGASGWDAFIQWAKEHFKSFRPMPTVNVENVDEMTTSASCRPKIKKPTETNIEMHVTSARTVFVEESKKTKTNDSDV